MHRRRLPQDRLTLQRAIGTEAEQREDVPWLQLALLQRFLRRLPLLLVREQRILQPCADLVQLVWRLGHGHGELVGTDAKSTVGGKHVAW